MMVVESTSAPQRAVKKPLVVARNLLAAVVLVALAACATVSTPTTPAGGMQALEVRARAAADSGNFAAASDLYTQLAAGATGPRRTDYLIEAARLSAEHGDTALARRRLGETRGAASREQQQSIGVLSARLELLDRRPQAALDMLAAVPQPLPAPALAAAAAVRGQALFALGQPVKCGSRMRNRSSRISA
jgi:outer membrane PBP1 activator LpoA protein